ncbi:EamA family transporter [Nanoarchaeota archaeon]
MSLIFPIFLVFVSTVIGGFGSVYLKKGSHKLSLSIQGLVKNYQLIFGIVMYVLSAVIFITALRFGELSVLYPISSISYIWISLLSVMMLNEKMNKFKWGGIALIILGVILVTA